MINKQNAIQKANLENPKHESNDSIVVNLPQTNNELGRTSEKLANIAGVSEKTYRMGAKVLNLQQFTAYNQSVSDRMSITSWQYR